MLILDKKEFELQKSAITRVPIQFFTKILLPGNHPLKYVSKKPRAENPGQKEMLRLGRIVMMSVVVLHDSMTDA